MRVKVFIVKILAAAGRGIMLALRAIFGRRAFVFIVINAAVRLFFRILVFPFYRFGYSVRHSFVSVYAPVKSRFFYVLNRPFWIHAVIIFLGLTISVNNLMADELRDENFGEQTIIYSVVSKEPIEQLLEETKMSLPEESVLSYLDKSAMLEAQKAIIQPDGAEERFMSGFSTVIEGGAAVVKPNIIQPVPAAELPSQASASRQGVVMYVVQEGETVITIAKKFNVSVETILWQNNLGPKSIIHVGDKLEILPTSGVMHKVKKGETIGSIAAKYKITIDKIISYNNLFDVSDIKISQQLIIPGGQKIVAIAPPYAAGNIPKVAPISKLFVPPSQKVIGEGFLWPTAVRRITQYFSWRHSGLDIAGPKGTPIYASEGGTVTYSGWSKGYGYNMLIDHGNGMKTRYAHNSKLFVEKGVVVAKGQTIAAMGSTGWSTGSHVHFEIYVNGIKVNPLTYVK